MEYIGTDKRGRTMFLKVSLSRVTCYHIKDTGYDRNDKRNWKGVTEKSHEITTDDYYHYTLNYGAAFYDYINSKYNITL